ncbi:hypothetical protein ACLMJK_004792 [Lecanora helva]
MSKPSESTSMLALAESLRNQVADLDGRLKHNSVSPPSLAVGASTELWSSQPDDIENIRSSIFGITKQLTKLLQGPHEFLHEYVSPNWEHGALYTLLEFNVLEQIPLHGPAHVSFLASRCGLHEKKLLSMLRLISCEEIIKETSEGEFCHTAISEDLVRDEKFKAWVGFQLFETRIASANLADSMKANVCDYQEGPSAFKYAWGSSMYDWHRMHPEKSARFRMAMEGVTRSLDPGNTLYKAWFKSSSSRRPTSVVDVGGRNIGFLSAEFPAFNFETQADNFEPPRVQTANERRLVYLIRNILWNYSDADCIKMLRAYVPILERAENAMLLINEMISPALGTFATHVEKGYRRRDVTVMTMHNAKQRTEAEWRDLFTRANENFTV